MIAAAALTGSIGKLLQLAQLAVATLRGVVAAVKAGGGGDDLPEDAELIRILADNSATGKAEATALVARLQAIVDAQAGRG